MSVVLVLSAMIALFMLVYLFYVLFRGDTL